MKAQYKEKGTFFEILAHLFESDTLVRLRCLTTNLTHRIERDFGLEMKIVKELYFFLNDGLYTQFLR